MLSAPKDEILTLWRTHHGTSLFANGINFVKDYDVKTRIRSASTPLLLSICEQLSNIGFWLSYILNQTCWNICVLPGNSQLQLTLSRICGPFTIFGSLAFSILPIWRAINVLPVPGGPKRSIPRTCFIPKQASMRCHNKQAGKLYENYQVVQ